MTWVDEGELRALQARAYGPGADIHRDPEALERLRQLEFALRPPLPPVDDEPQVKAIPDAPPARVPAEPEPEPVEPLAQKLLRGARAGWARLRTLRRSTVLIALAVAAFVTVVAVVLVLVQRVQVNPLQPDAEQVARLSPDPGYELPRIFSFGTEDERPIAFQSFHGLRATVSSGSFYRPDSSGECLSVFSESVITDPETDTFNGPIFFGCSAGSFPAVAQFSSQQQDMPESLLVAYPEAIGLQFVYDRENNEVVVFAAP